MFFATITPPAVHATVRPCADYKPQNLSVGQSAVIRSPDCKWLIVFKSDIEAQPVSPIKQKLGDDIAAVADAKTGRIIGRFSMERNASVHWLKDNRYLIVSYWAGSDSVRPLAISLRHNHQSTAHDLSTLVFSDVLRRIHHSRKQVYHYYVTYIADLGDRVTIAAEPNYTMYGEEGAGGSNCLIYTIDKASFSHYRFIKEVPERDCPSNPDGP